MGGQGLGLYCPSFYNVRSRPIQIPGYGLLAPNQSYTPQHPHQESCLLFAPSSLVEQLEETHQPWARKWASAGGRECLREGAEDQDLGLVKKKMERCSLSSSAFLIPERMAITAGDHTIAMGPGRNVKKKEPWANVASSVKGLSVVKEE